MAEFKVEARRHPVITGAIVGAIFGYLYTRFWWFRLAILIGLAYLCFSFTYDWLFTERTLPANTRAVVMQADILDIPDTHFSNENLTVRANYAVENVYNQTVDHLKIQTSLYDCSSPSSPLSQCKLLKRKVWMPGVDLAPGKTWTATRTTTFDNAPPLTGFARIAFDHSDVVVDSDNEGREPR